MTAHDVVARVRRRLGGERVGHTGTLDPDAAGVLVLAVGRARHLLAWMDLTPKSYWGRLACGIGTDSLDAAGRVVSRSKPPWPSRADWERAARLWLGARVQLPPQVSAKRVSGQRAYQAARRGERLWLKPAPIVIDALAVEAAADNWMTFLATVSTGTYVRSLVRDWADLLGHTAHLTTLIRTRVGPFALADAATLEEWEADGLGWTSQWQVAWRHPVVQVAPGERTRVLKGQLPPVRWSGPAALADGATLLAVVDDSGFRHVFNEGWVGR